MASSARISKTVTISLPPELAAKAELLAKRESRTMSELFREALRRYEQQRSFETLDDIRQYAATRNPQGHTEADVPRLIREVREEMAAEERSGKGV
jgi:CopG family transcriptional regulator/antitoxin EndoAI